MKHIFIVIAVATLYSGAILAYQSFGSTVSYKLVCIKETGVYYVQFSSGAAPLLNAAGRPVSCEE